MSNNKYRYRIKTAVYVCPPLFTGFSDSVPESTIKHVNSMHCILCDKTTIDEWMLSYKKRHISLWHRTALLLFNLKCKFWLSLEFKMGHCIFVGWCWLKFLMAIWFPCLNKHHLISQQTLQLYQPLKITNATSWISLPFEQSKHVVWIAIRKTVKA